MTLPVALRIPDLKGQRPSAMALNLPLKVQQQWQRRGNGPALHFIARKRARKQRRPSQREMGESIPCLILLPLSKFLPISLRSGNPKALSHPPPNPLPAPGETGKREIPFSRCDTCTLAAAGTASGPATASFQSANAGRRQDNGHQKTNTFM